MAHPHAQLTTSPNASTRSGGRLAQRVIACALSLGLGVLAGGPQAREVSLGLAALLALCVVAYLALTASATLLATLMLMSLVISGNSGLLGLPIGPDRLLFVATAGALVRDALQGRSQGLPLRFQPVHTVLLLVSSWAILSALTAGTLGTTDGAFALLDRLGLVPFFAFALAPRLFGTPAQRQVLLIGLVVTGAYLALTALAEGLDLDALIFPRYIDDVNVGIHYGRARGPFLEAVAMGYALLVCAVGALVAVSKWRQPAARTVAMAVAVGCALGSVFTLTRAVWLGFVLAFVAVTAITPRLRRYAFSVVAGSVIVLVTLLAIVPALSASVSERARSERPVWDRYNSNVAAVNAIEDRPLTGVGWQRFEEVSDDYTEQRPDYPVTGVGIEVHNVFLSHAAELGLPGGALYVLAWLSAVVPPLLRTGGSEHYLWRRALLAVAVMWFVVASFGPLSYPFANLALWLFAGIAGTTALQGRQAPETALAPSTPRL